MSSAKFLIIILLGKLKVESCLLYAVQGVEKVAEVWIFSVQRFPLMALALQDQALGDDAELLAVGQRLPVRVRRCCYKE